MPQRREQGDAWAYARREPPTPAAIAQDACSSGSGRVAELMEWAEERGSRVQPGATPDQLAVTANTGGRRVAVVCQLAPASDEANTSPEVAPK